MASPGEPRVLQGRYRVVSVLGRGGFGTLYLCEDVRLSGKRWAVRELVCPDPELLPEARRAFEGEARRLSTLRHRNLAVVVDFFTEGGGDHLVMEPVEGRTLSRLIEEEGPARVVEALRWTLETARVLDYLHQQDPPVELRDLAPDNVMITEDRHVKVIDLGMVRRVLEPRDDSAASGGAWDVRRLGAMLFFLLAGHAPGEGSHRLSPHRQGLDPEVEALVLRCLDDDPSRRWPGVAELIRQLLRLLSRQEQQEPAAEPAPPRARPVEPRLHPTKAPPPTRRYARAEAVPAWLPVILALATVLYMAGAVLGAARVWQEPASPRERGRAYDVASPEKDRARALLDRGELRQAAAELDAAVTRHPADAEAHILKENTFARLSGARPLKIPALVSLTGVDVVGGHRLLHGIAAAQTRFNRAGGLDGRPLVVDLYDDASDTEQALTLARKIIDDPDYTVMLGPLNSQRTLAVAPLFNAARTPLLTPVAADPRVWEAGPYVFTAADSFFPRIRALARRLVGSGLRRGAILVDRDSVLSATMATYFRDQFEGLGGQVDQELSYTHTDFSAQVDALRASPPDFVFFGDYRGLVLAHFATALRGAGLQMPLASQVAPFEGDLVEGAGPAAEGILLSGYFHQDIQRPELQDYVRRFHEAFGDDLVPTHLDANAYDCTELLLDAFAGGARTREQVRAWLASVGSSRPPYRGATGTFALARRLDGREVYLMEVRGGEYRVLEEEPAR